jgi:hypothetical protein
MKYSKQDSRVCLFYVTERLHKLSDIKNDVPYDNKLRKKLYEFKNECIHNLGVDALHNHFSKK